MNLEKLFQRLLPHIVALLIFIAVSCIFVYPIFQGKTLQQNDVREWMGSFQEVKTFQEATHERSLWTNSMFGGMPTYQIAPYSPNTMVGTIYIYNLIVAGWSLPAPANSILLYCMGFYLLLLVFRVNRWIAVIGAIAYAFCSFNIIIIEAGHVIQAWTLGSAAMVMAAIIYTLRYRKYLLGGALFALAFAINLRCAHVQMTYYTGIMIGIFLIYEFIQAIRQKTLANFFICVAIFAVGAGIAIGSSATLQLTTYEYTAQTTRGKSDLKHTGDKAAAAKQKAASDDEGTGGGLDVEYAFAHSYDQGEAFCLMIPNFRGGASAPIALEDKDAIKDIQPAELKQVADNMPAYWGGQAFTSGPVYVGAIICFLFVLALFTFKSDERWWLLAVVVLSILLAMGKYLMGFNMIFFNHFPMYNKFRSVAFVLSMASVAMPLLAMLGLNNLFVNKQAVTAPDFRRNLFISLGLTGGFCLLFFVAPSMAGSFQKDDTEDKRSVMEMLSRSGLNESQTNEFMNANFGTISNAAIEGRESLLSADALRSLIFILLAGAVIFAYYRGMLKDPKVAIGLIGALIFIDMFSLDKRYLNADNFKPKRAAVTFTPTEADNYILQDKDPDYRVINISATNGNNPFNDATTSYFHKSVGGYHGAKLRRFQEMNENTNMAGKAGAIGQYMAQAPPQQRSAMLDQFQQQGFMDQLDMMNTKYIIVGDGQAPTDVVKNPYATGSVWFVKAIRKVNDADEELAAIKHFNPKDTAIVDINTRKEFGTYIGNFSPANDPTAKITLTEYHPNQVTYQSSAASEQFAVFSEVYYNSGLGWNAYLDGQKVEHIRTDFLLRGMRVPAGQHTIVFKFEPKTFALGEKISLICSLLLLAGLIGAIVLEVRKANKDTEGHRTAAAA